MPRKWIFAYILVLLLTAAAPAAAQTVSSPDSTITAILDSIRGIPLALSTAIDTGLQNTVAVRRAAARLTAAQGSVRHESGAFDPTLFAGILYKDQSEPTASFFSGAPVLSLQQTTSHAGVHLDLPVGTRLELSMNTVRLATNSSFAFLNPEYDAFGSLSIRQSLLRGFMASARKDLTRSERELDAARDRYHQQVLAATSDIERSYWDLYAAERDYAVQILTRNRADAFLHETEVRERTGLAGPNDLASARTFLAEQSLVLIDREEQFDRQSDILAALIGMRPGSGLPRFVASNEPPADYPSGTADSLVALALQNNLEIRAARQDAEAADVMASAAGWEALPDIAVTGSLGGSGLSGTPQDVIFNGDTLRTTRSGTAGDALRQVTHRDFPNWSVGLEVSIPIGFRSGLGDKDRLDAAVVEAREHVTDLSRSLETDVRASWREVEHGRDRIRAARSGVDAAEDQVRIGAIAFHNGRSTAFELVRLGEDLAVAQRRYSDALVRTAKAASLLNQLTSGGFPTTVDHH